MTSVVVVHYRQQAQLDRTLAALAAQTQPPREVIVADDGSPEPPVVPGGVRLLRQEDRGFRAGAARNLGARHATGDVLCFLDADTAPEPEFLERLTAAIDGDVVAVGRRRHWDYERGVELPAPEWLARGYAETANLAQADDRSYRYVISSVLAVPRAFFERVGPFDESFAEYGGEDWEWAHRAWLAGARFTHVPEAVAWHDGPEWAGRGPDRGAKNREAIRLADAIGVPGSRGHGLRPGRPDVVVRVAGGSVAATFVCVDSILAVLPEAVVVAPGLDVADPRVVADAPPARIEVEVRAPVRVRGAELRALVDGLTEAVDLGAIRVAHARAARVERRVVDWLEPLEDEPDVEGYLGGWA